MRWIGTLVPTPQIQLLPAVILCASFFASAKTEELGWSGFCDRPYAEPLRRARGRTRLGNLPLRRVVRSSLWTDKVERKGRDLLTTCAPDEARVTSGAVDRVKWCRLLIKSAISRGATK